MDGAGHTIWQTALPDTADGDVFTVYPTGDLQRDGAQQLRVIAKGGRSLLDGPTGRLLPYKGEPLGGGVTSFGDDLGQVTVGQQLVVTIRSGRMGKAVLTRRLPQQGQCREAGVSAFPLADSRCADLIVEGLGPEHYYAAVLHNLGQTRWSTQAAQTRPAASDVTAWCGESTVPQLCTVGRRRFETPSLGGASTFPIPRVLALRLAGEGRREALRPTDALRNLSVGVLRSKLRHRLDPQALDGRPLLKQPLDQRRRQAGTIEGVIDSVDRVAQLLRRHLERLQVLGGIRRGAGLTVARHPWCLTRSTCCDYCRRARTPLRPELACYGGQGRSRPGTATDGRRPGRPPVARRAR